MTIRLTLLLLHIALLLLASTCFTVVTGVNDGHFKWEYFQYSTQSGWGVPYRFTYSLPVALAYLAAYATGVTTYCIAYRGGSHFIGLAGMLLCSVGFASFALELSHWFVEQNQSFIISAPIALLALAPADAVQQYRGRTSAPVHDGPK